MSIPLITNRNPAPDRVSGVVEPFRCSLRDLDGHILPGSINSYILSGPAYWPGGYLPEDSNKASFSLGSLYGTPTVEAARSIVPGTGALKLEKLSAGNEKAVYSFGGLDSPTDPDGPLGVQFTLELAQADVSPDGFGFTGVLVGMKIRDTGVAIKFYTVGGTRRIEMHDAAYLTAAPPSPAYVSYFDWDQSQSRTYLLLWYPKQNAVKLYASSGMEDDTPDELLISGAISDFPSLGPDEIPKIPPSVYFGHGYPTSTSTSYWHKISLANAVSSPIVDGYFQGEHTGFILSDEVVNFTPSELPRQGAHPWLLIPESIFTSVDGSEDVSTTERRVKISAASGSSYGFYRKEAKLQDPSSAFLMDIRASGVLIDRTSGPGPTGMEIFVDDGVKQVRLAFLDTGNQSVGLLGASSYSSYNTNWLNERNYRLLVDPLGFVRVILFRSDSSGFLEETILSAPYSSLPSTFFPSPSLGFLVNGLSASSSARLSVGPVRYSPAVYHWDSENLPASPWVLIGTGTPYLSNGKMVLESPASGLYYRRSLPEFTTSRGCFAEFLGSVSEYEARGLKNPRWENTGVGLRFNDGTYQYTLLLADAGPAIGKILYLATDSDYNLNLRKIRYGDNSVSGTYASVDWSLSHLYRVERSIGGMLSVWIDEDEDPLLEIETHKFSPPLSANPQSMDFGSLMVDRKSTSLWSNVRFGVSSGFDVSVFPILSEAEKAKRFDNVVCTLVEAESV